MNKKKNVILAATLGAFFLLTSFKMPHLPTDSHDSALVFSEAAKGVHIATKVYTSDESKNYLHHDFIGRGVVPVEIFVRNSTANSYELSAASVALPCMRGKELAWKETKKSLPRGIALRIASLFFWPLLIPSTIDGIITYKSHRNLVKDLEAKTLKEKKEVIPPYATVSRILYVKKEGFEKEFSVTLQEVDSEELVVIRTGVPQELAQEPLDEGD